MGAFLLAGTLAVVGYGLSRDAEERQEAAVQQQLAAASARQRDALLGQREAFLGMDETGGAFAWDGGALRFDAEAAPSESPRSIFDDKGRIVGWVSAKPAPAAARSVYFWPTVAACLGLAVLFAWLAISRMRQTVETLAARAAAAEKTANEDRLTGLPHRGAMLTLLDRALALRRPDEVIGLVFFNVDGFKEVNDIHGHETGDQLLAALAERLTESLPQKEMGGRVGADEFAVIIKSGSAQSAIAAIEFVAAQLAKHYWIGGRTLTVGVSAGFALAPADAATREEMTACANLALRAAKRSGGGKIVAFSADMKNESAERRFIERELKDALAAGDLDVHYQPIVAANGAGMVGVEALLRWHHRERGQIAPPDFVSVAEQCGLMGELGEFVLRKALTDVRRWPGLFVAVNLSPVQVRDRLLVDVVQRALADTGIAPARLLLEITEGVLIDNPEEARDRLDALRALGIGLALDDFGTGFSSLSYLQRFPFDKLKVDKSFVEPLGRSANAGAMIQAIVALGRALGLSVLVEGVETEEQRVLLRLAGCDEMQGFRFGRPGPPYIIDRMRAAGRRQAVAAGQRLRTGIAET
jgi:diguanylate cyclase (GGDEF)-like protein